MSKSYETYTTREIEFVAVRATCSPPLQFLFESSDIGPKSPHTSVTRIFVTQRTTTGEAIIDGFVWNHVWRSFLCIELRIKLHGIENSDIFCSLPIAAKFRIQCGVISLRNMFCDGCRTRALRHPNCSRTWSCIWACCRWVAASFRKLMVFLLLPTSQTFVAPLHFPTESIENREIQHFYSNFVCFSTLLVPWSRPTVSMWL